jgi:hypothetical protein
MHYIYDVSVNLNKKYIDFFEWEKQDKIITITKAPLIKVNQNTFNDIMSNNIKLSEETISKIIKPTFKYYLIMTNDNIIMVKFNKKGINELKSSLEVTDELDILENSRGIKEIKIDYQVISKENIIFQTRFEKKMIKFLSSEINKLSIPMDNEKIKYLYLECYGTEESNSHKALSIIKKNFNNSNELNKMYQIFKLIEQK